MVKVIRSFSLSPRTIQLIEKHVHDPYLGQVNSRSAVVEQAILWYLDKRFKPFDPENPEKDWEQYDRNIAELSESQEKLIAKVRELAIERNTPPIVHNLSWWKRLLGLRA
jgi:hypothetical protein